ncbi:hypothetical protein RhiirA4_538298 [Rhizophagus irregularis]|uniref:Uncharacterized protein n=1 Tax=Rhizophagus irregularis TaxID=588596 RepID=A0A2I1FZA5_9GLOM|nr:hypothetical protein RhiirA4_538298 [Rhizophagus irregularis]
MAENKKWKLSSEKIVEDTMFRYGMKLNEESLIHSWILDLEDTRLKKLFTKEEWNEIKVCNINKVPKIPEDLAEHMVSYAENDLRALRKKVLRSWINPDDEYDPRWQRITNMKSLKFRILIISIDCVISNKCTFYERNSSPLERDMLENWYNINIWSIIFDRCFEQLEVVTCIRGESSSIASSERKNKDRNLDKRKKMGRRNDRTIRERNGRCEFRLVEAAKKFEENSTKWLKESFKTPKIMRDMLVQLMSVVKNDDRAKKLRTVGWLHFGLYAQTLEMDCANGYVCRLICRELHKVGKGLDRDGIADTLALLTAVLQTRYIVAETYNIIKMPEAPDKTLLLRIIDKVGSSLPKSSDKEVPTTARTPKKGRFQLRKKQKDIIVNMR